MKTRLFVLSLAFTTPLIASATVRVSEIMYDVSGSDTGREWIEVVNQGKMPIDLSTYKVFEGGVNHKIVAIKGDALLAPGESAVIADNATKFLADWPDAPGAIFDSTFSLSNSGETIGINTKDLASDDTVAFVAGGASGNGLSLARGDDGQLISAKPTPGVYVKVPTKVTITPPAPTVTPQTTSGLQPVAPTQSAGDSKVVTASAPIEERLAESGADAEKSTTSPVWVWALGALGLSLLGAGSIYALKVHTIEDETDARNREHRALQKEAATYEIIE